MFLILIMLVIVIVVVCPSQAITVSNSYKQSGAQCNFIGSASAPRYPVSLAKCASLCTESESCSSFATIPGEQCALFETCHPVCTSSHGGVGWTIYTVDDQRCHGGWTRYRDSYYLVVHDNNNMWYHARDFCTSNQSKIAEVDSQDEDTFIRNMLTYGKNYWLGGENFASGGLVFEWHASKKSLSYTNWAPTQPDDTHVDICVMYWSDDTYSPLKWADNWCYEHHGFICERV